MASAVALIVWGTAIILTSRTSDYVAIFGIYSLDMMYIHSIHRPCT